MYITRFDDRIKNSIKYTKVYLNETRVMMVVMFASSLTRFRCRPLFAYVERFGIGGIIRIFVGGTEYFGEDPCIALQSPSHHYSLMGAG